MLVTETEGLALQGENYLVMKKVGVAGDTIERHNHPEANVLFTVVKGRIEVTVGDETAVLTPGKMLQFDGINYINATLLVDSEAFVTLIRKKI